MKKKVFSIILAAAMLTGINAYAADETKLITSSPLIYGKDIVYNNASAADRAFNYPWTEKTTVGANAADSSTTLGASSSATNMARIHSLPIGFDSDRYGTGNYTVGASFRFNTTDGTIYAPITLASDLTDNYRTSAATVIVSNGALWASVYKPADITTNGNRWVEYPTTADTSDWKKICSISTDAWYDIRITYNVDGDAATFDTYSYEISDGSSVYTGGPYALGKSHFYMGSGKAYSYDMTKLTRIYLGNAFKKDAGTATSASVDLKNYTLEYPADTLKIVSSTVADGAVNAAPDEAVRLTFNREIGEMSKSFVKLKSNGAEVAASITLSEDKKSMTIIPEAGFFNGNTSYSIELPKNFVSKEAYAMESAAEITFTTGKALEYIFKNDGTVYSESGDYRRISWNNGKWGTATEDGRTAIKITTEGATGGDYAYWRRNKENELGAGSYVVQTVFKAKNANAKYFPITFEADTTNTDNIYRQIKTVWIEDGKFWAKAADAPNSIGAELCSDSAKEEICAVDGSKWYELKIFVNCDGDAATVDTYSYELNDGSSVYTGGPYALGQPINDYKVPGYAMTGIRYVGFGSCPVSAANTPEIYFDSFCAYKNDSLAEPTAVKSSGGISLTFGEALNPRTLTAVSVYKSGEESAKLPAVCTLSEDGKTLEIKAKGIELSGRYTVKVPKNTVSLTNKALAEDYTAEFETSNAAQAAELANSECIGTLEKGGTVAAETDCTNVSGIKADITIKAVIENAEGSALAEKYVKSSYNIGETKTVKMSMTVPEGAACVRLYAYSANGTEIKSAVLKKG